MDWCDPLDETTALRTKSVTVAFVFYSVWPCARFSFSQPFSEADRPLVTEVTLSQAKKAVIATAATFLAFLDPAGSVARSRTDRQGSKQ